MGTVFEETSMAGMKLKNRIIRSATHEGMGDKDGRPLPELGDLYVKLAQGGVGAIITGFAAIQKNGRCTQNMRMFDRDVLIDDYLAINNRLSTLGVPLINQIVHGGGQINSELTGEKPLGPSRKKYSFVGNTSRALAEHEISHIIDNFTQAIERSRKAGFAGVQLHAGHGYLLHAFLSPHLNVRTDRWGGSTENRFRILAEIIHASRERVGNYPILVKFSAYDADKHGMRIEESLRYAELFQKAGIDALEVSCGGATDGFHQVRVAKLPVEAALAFAPQLRGLPRPVKSFLRVLFPLTVKRHTPLANCNVEAAARIKQQVDLPVIVVGGIRRLDDMEQIIAEGKADYISLCRPFIIEPDIVNRFQSGKQNASRCIDCGYCWMGVTSNKLKCYYGRLSQNR